MPRYSVEFIETRVSVQIFEAPDRDVLQSEIDSFDWDFADEDSVWEEWRVVEIE